MWSRKVSWYGLEKSVGITFCECFRKGSVICFGECFKYVEDWCQSGNPCYFPGLVHVHVAPWYIVVANCHLKFHPELCPQGASVVIADLGSSAGAETAQEIGDKVTFVETDVSDE